MDRIALNDLTDRILCADQREIFGILDAAVERFSELFPEKELLTFAVEGSRPDSQIDVLRRAIELLSSSK